MNDITSFTFEDTEIPILMTETQEKSPIAGRLIVIPTFHTLLDVSKQFSWHTTHQLEIRVREDIQVRFFYRGHNILNRSWTVRNYFTLSQLESAMDFLKPSFEAKSYQELSDFILKIKGA